MIKNQSRYVVIVTLVFFLSGCVLQTEQLSVLVKGIRLGKEQLDSSIQSVPVPTASSVQSVPLQPRNIEYNNQDLKLMQRIRHYDWNSAMKPMVSRMLQAYDITVGSLLLVDNVINRTNGSLNAMEVTEILNNTLANNKKFILVSAQQISVAKQQLGLSPQDSLESCSKAISIARNIGAHYVLYSKATGNINSPSLQMQLMLVQTGEIIWSGKCVVIQL